jgi:hypothetical protein
MQERINNNNNNPSNPTLMQQLQLRSWFPILLFTLGIVLILTLIPNIYNLKVIAIMIYVALYCMWIINRNNN